MKRRSLVFAASIIVLAIMAFGTMQKFKPVPAKTEPVVVKTTVEAMTVTIRDHPVQIGTHGRIEPLTETRAASEVAGPIIAVAPDFRAGGSFQTGDVLVEIDPVDYQAAVAAEAEAALADAKLALETEQARAEQAQRDWKKLAPNEKPGPLVQRLPHVASATARMKAAAAAVDKARHDLERTQFRAPYPARIKARSVDLGDYVSPGSRIADLWRSDVFEVRLPVSIDEFAQIDLKSEQPAVNLKVTAGGETTTWRAGIVRSEGTIDPSTRMIFLVARMESPEPEPLPGTFVTASIEGRPLKGVAAIPRKALIGDDRVVIIEPDNTLRNRSVTVAWTDRERVFVRQGLKDGDRVCLTALAAVVDGMPVEPIAVPAEPSVTRTEPAP